MPRKLGMVVDDAFFAAEVQAAGLIREENSGLIKSTLLICQQSYPRLINLPKLGMEVVWKIEVVDLPAFILVNDKGNDFYKQLGC